MKASLRTDKVTVTVSESGSVTITTPKKKVVVTIDENGDVTTQSSEPP